MPRPKKVQTEAQILSQTEISELKQEKRELESTLDALDKEGVGHGTAAQQIDRSHIRREIARLDKAVVEGTPGKISGNAKDKLAEEAAALAERIQQGMPTFDEMRDPMRNPGAIRKNVEWERRNKPAIERWKQIQRQLEHGDPTASNVERLRRR